MVTVLHWGDGKIWSPQGGDISFEKKKMKKSGQPYQDIYQYIRYQIFVNFQGQLSGTSAVNIGDGGTRWWWCKIITKLSNSFYY